MNINRFEFSKVELVIINYQGIFIGGPSLWQGTLVFELLNFIHHNYVILIFLDEFFSKAILTVGFSLIPVFHFSGHLIPELLFNVCHRSFMVRSLILLHRVIVLLIFVDIRLGTRLFLSAQSESEQ